MSNKPNYKTSRKYKCPYCDIKDTRSNLMDHIDSKHQELIPEGYTPSRVIFDFINGKNYGTCMICKNKVYEWNDKVSRYNNLCNNKSCRAKVREIALERHMKVYNKPTLLNDAEHQEKMLANRRISGSYTFTDGGKVTYTGQYEKKALEFIDKVLEIPSKDIQSPGPVLEYEYKGEVHKWITDIYYIPANLLIEVKDGGSNPNNRTMTTYREKQIAKEVMITNLGTFNYLRLTNNDFSQLLDILADMKNEALLEENPKVKIHINEEVGGLPAQRPPEAYIIPYGMNNVFDGFGYSDSEMDSIIISDNNKLKSLSKDEFKSIYDTAPYLIYIGEDISNKINKIHNDIKYGNVNNINYFIETLLGYKFHDIKDIVFSEKFVYYDEAQEKKICQLIENGITNHEISDNIVKTIGNIYICQSPKGYYAITPSNFYMASEYFPDLSSLEQSNIIQLMNDVYIRNTNNNIKGGINNEQYL